MKRGMWLAVAGLLVQAAAGAEWVSLSEGLPETDMLSVAVAPKEGALYAASAKRLYRQGPNGWKQVLSLRGDRARIHQVLVSAVSPGTLYVATDKGVQKSVDGGRKWQRLYQGIGPKAKTVHALLESPSGLLMGTEQGLVHAGFDGTVRKIAVFPETTVHSLAASRDGAFRLAGTSEGIYKSADGESWEKVEALFERTSDEEQALSQFEIEELPSVLPKVLLSASADGFLAASSRGVLQSSADARAWQKSPAPPAPSIRGLAASGKIFYAATDRGVYRREDGSFRDISDGLATPDVRALFYDEGSGDLYAASASGVYRYPKPEIKIELPSAELFRPADLLARFDHEPGVGEIQRAAIHYAEVSPEKIESWRSAAARRAFLPTLSVGTDMGEDQNIDLDRGGTNDPDRFIVGPEESTFDWHVDLSWDLADLVWNGDQTSIDTRSKLMVELRDDVLNEVTHLYFERRRLQADLALAPPASPALQIEKELKLQELTAGIDALTGGYLSRSLSETKNVRRG